MRFKQFITEAEMSMFTPSVEEKQALEALRLIRSKYPEEYWSPDLKTAKVEQPEVAQHINYVMRKLKLPPADPVQSLQQWLGVAKLAHYPDQDPIQVHYNDSGLYDCCDETEIAPNETATLRVMQKGLAAFIQGQIRPLRRAVVRRA